MKSSFAQNPALAALLPLIGRWKAEVVFPSDPPGTLIGEVSFDWFDDGAFIVFRSQLEGNGPPRSVSVIGRDDASGAFQMLYYDERGVSRIYAMTFEKGTWTLQGKPVDFFQRFRGTLQPEGRIAGSWEKSDDGQQWEHDFSVNYIRIA